MSKRQISWGTCVGRGFATLAVLAWIAGGTAANAAGKKGAVAPGDGSYSEVVLQEGQGWRLVNASGTAGSDSGGEGRNYNQNLYMIQSRTGAYNAPLSPSIQDELALASEDESTVFAVDQRIAEEIAYSEQTGRLTDYLRSIAEPLDGEGTATPAEPGPADPMLTGKRFAPAFGSFDKGGCDDQEKKFSKSLSLSSPITLASGNLGSGFSGSLSASGTIQGTATGEVFIKIKRKKILFVCVPYAVKFDRAHAFGNLLANYGATLSGTLSYANPNPWEWEVAKPSLGSLNFLIGPIPVHIGFNLPINVGLELQASVTGSITYTGGQTAQGTFDYTCKTSGCTGTSSFNQTGSTTPAVTGSASVRIKPTVSAQASVRAFLYTEWLAYVQVGLRGYLYGDLWGFYGNNCGDANADGVFETVDALTFDLDWQLKVKAAASAFGGNPTDWTLWTSSRYHINFWDLVGSEAIQPLLTGPAAVPVNTLQTYNSKMRPCWPYTDNVTYSLNWGDGSAPASFSGAPQSFVAKSKSWSAPGTKTLQLTAVSDAHGRNLGKTTSRNVQIN